MEQTRLTDEQREAALLFKNGFNVGVQAIPGAGKTALLLEACVVSPKPCLILAYNNQLASDIRRALVDRDLQADVTCLTFHSLCSRCILPSKDDVGVLNSLHALKEGLEPHDVPEARRVLIDESQDVRELYVRLLTSLHLCCPHVPTMVVGDRMQLIYDFDPDFPATEETLLRPEAAFSGGVWKSIVLSRSHRLTRPMSLLVNSLFGTSVLSTKQGCAVEVRCGNPFRSFLHLQDVLLQEGSKERVMILVDRKKSNRSLCLLLNELSKSGVPVHLHGVDSEDEAAKRGKLCCSTWWAAKGMQQHTVVVIVPRFTPLKPLYVALTRGFSKLVLFMNEREPHAALCCGIASLPDDVVSMDDRTRRIVLKTSLEAEDSFDDTKRAAAAGGHRDLESWRAPRELTELFQVEATTPSYGEESSTIFNLPSGMGDVGHAVSRMALSYSELLCTGRIRSMEDVIHTKKVDLKHMAEAVEHGLASRCISTSRPEADVLLADDLKSTATSSYDRLLLAERDLVPNRDLAICSLACIAWDGYDHCMRQLLPVEAWCDSAIVERAKEVALSHFPSSLDRWVDYDLRVKRRCDDRVLHIRAAACERSTAFAISWKEEEDHPSHEVLTRAATTAALHPSGRCTLVDLFHGWVKVVTVPNPSLLLSRI